MAMLTRDELSPLERASHDDHLAAKRADFIAACEALLRAMREAHVQHLSLFTRAWSSELYVDVYHESVYLSDDLDTTLRFGGYKCTATQAYDARMAAHTVRTAADAAYAECLASIAHAAEAHSQQAKAYAAARPDPRDPDPSRPGIFRDHNCWKCHDGTKPCASGNPHQCEYPRARND